VFRGRPIEVPALFVGGDRDGPTIWGMPSIERFPKTLPRLHRSIILPGCGHWTQQERPAEVNEALLEFLASVGVRTTEHDGGLSISAADAAGARYELVGAPAPGDPRG